MRKRWIVGKIGAEVLDKYKIEDSRKEAFIGRGASLEWRRVAKERNEWLEKMKKKEDEKKQDGGDASTQGDANDEECAGESWSLAQNHEAYSMGEGAQILKKEEEDARLLDCCEAKRKQCGEDVENVEEKLWKMQRLAV